MQNNQNFKLLSFFLVIITIPSIYARQHVLKGSVFNTEQFDTDDTMNAISVQCHSDVDCTHGPQVNDRVVCQNRICECKYRESSHNVWDPDKRKYILQCGQSMNEDCDGASLKCMENLICRKDRNPTDLNSSYPIYGRCECIWETEVFSLRLGCLPKRRVGEFCHEDVQCPSGTTCSMDVFSQTQMNRLCRSPLRPTPPNVPPNKPTDYYTAIQIYKITMILASSSLGLVLVMFLLCILKRTYCPREGLPSHRRPSRRSLRRESSIDLATVLQESAIGSGIPFNIRPPYEKPPSYDESQRSMSRQLGIPPPPYDAVVAVVGTSGPSRLDPSVLNVPSLTTQIPVASNSAINYPVTSRRPPLPKRNHHNCRGHQSHYRQCHSSPTTTAYQIQPPAEPEAGDQRPSSEEREQNVRTCQHSQRHKSNESDGEGNGLTNAAFLPD